jgi:hypothetical protein
MTRQKRERLALILSAIAFLLIFLPGVILAGVMQEKDNANERADWGQEMICPITGQDNPLIVRRWTGQVQREVNVVCADNQPRTALMMRDTSMYPTTSVWYNSNTGTSFIRYDMENSDNRLSPSIWSNWPFIQIPFALVAFIVARMVRARIRNGKSRSDAAGGTPN